MKTGFTRRDFLKLAGTMTATAALPEYFTQIFAAGLERMAATTRVVWLQGQSCSGESISLLNSVDPSPADLLTRYISLVIHQNIGAAQGQTFMDTLKKAAQTNDYLLVIEGAIPLKMPQACMIAGRPFETTVLELIPNAKAILAVGTCASFGGIPAADGNDTGSVGVKEFMEHHNLRWQNKLVNCPSCPTHPVSIVGTLAYLATGQYPEVHKELLAPRMYYQYSTHDHCPRYHDFERKIFAEHFGQPEGCLFKLGCLGPLTSTECPNRQWNSGVNWCIRAAAPCIGCSWPGFCRDKEFPLYRIGETAHSVTYTEKDRSGGKI
ncbi:MAG: hydrogenase small subunit [Planctomycetes bacterium]|nr:hydrogenase small subunit [Planctomycetota bacterium]